LQDVRLAFGGPELLDGATLHIERGERVCLVGRNGVGKSTLMRMIGGVITPDSGKVVREQGVSIASLEQEVPKELSGTVFEVVSEGLGDIVDLLARYHQFSIRLSHMEKAAEPEPDHSSRITHHGLITELERVQHLIEAAGGWQIQQRVDTVLSRLRLDPDAPAAELSGGYKRRVLLARALVNEPDLLLLDEPTNHLDIDSISWLEEFLSGFSGALLFITHDRRFLGNLATRIVELDRGRVTDWPGDYQTYLLRRQAELDAEAVHNALFDKKLVQEEAWIRQGIKARRTRNEGRVRALKELRNERLRRRELTGSAVMRLNEAERSGKLVIEVERVAHGYEGTPVIKNFSTTIMRGDKIGIIGPNGSGKTTLLQILLGAVEPDKGTVRLGTRLEIAYFDQHRAQLDYEKSVRENVGGGYDTVTINGRTRHIISYLQDFLFPPERARSPVKVLSGGERNRALLAKLFTKPSNMMVLDEPTNDLDSDTLELLEEMLIEYEGTVLLVSHDREFLNNIATSTIVFEGDGKVEEYVGGYDDWLRQRRTEPIEKKIQKSQKQRPERERARTLTFKEKRELDALPPLIESLECERNSLFETLGNPDFYKTQGEKIPELQKKIGELEKEIAEAYEKWELLDTISRAHAE
jgi:ABC transport system ATP-binding/permease protein